MELNAIIEEIIKAIGFHTAGLNSDQHEEVATAVKSHLDKMGEDLKTAVSPDVPPHEQGA